MSHSFRGVNLRPNLSFIAAICLAFAFFLAGLNRVPVPTVDGAVRASEARAVVQSGQWFPITYEGKTVSDHPPLYIWLTAISFKIFGINDFAANLPSRLAAFLTVLFVALIALQEGFGGGVALLAALILCLTRDFVLSSVRGYIEPLLECAIYAGLWFTLRQSKKGKLWCAAMSGVCIWIAAFAKGPPALWPFLFFGFLFTWNGQTARRRIQSLAVYFLSIGLCTAVWAYWNSQNGYWKYWEQYWFGQVLGSALEGRSGAQQFELFYFFKILGKYYWPWLPFLLWAFYRSIRWVWRFYLSEQAICSWIFGAFGLGFVLGFSLVQWKFWYYIAPAYPAFALFIAVSLYDLIPRKASKEKRFANIVLIASLAWIFSLSMFPVRTHRDRVPEVTAFKETIRNSFIPGPVWFMHNSMDHNLIATSGEWYFERSVVKVNDLPTSVPKAWIIADKEHSAACTMPWCKNAKLIQTAGKSALFYYER